MQVNAEYAQTESSRADTVVQDEMDKFEQMKLTDIKVCVVLHLVASIYFKYLEIFD
jgi:hypothetical protein